MLRPRRAAAAQVSYFEEEVENPYGYATVKKHVERGEDARPLKRKCISDPNPNHVTREKMTNLRGFVEETQKKANPFVAKLHLANERDFMRFVRYVRNTKQYYTFSQHVTKGFLCDTCFQGWKICRRTQNMHGIANSWGYSKEQCASWPTAGISWSNKGHDSYIFLKCTPKAVWTVEQAEAFKARIEELVHA
jgi:hypothetical protein